MDFSGYGIKWRTSFNDLNEETIVVDIYEDGWSSDPIILTAGRDPLETEWDDSQDIMTPLRTGSGNLRVINEGNLDGLMPTNTFQHLVKVSVGGIVKWVGFIQTQQFSHEMFLPLDTATYGLNDMLSGLDTIDMDRTVEFNLQTFGSLLLEMLVEMGGLIDSILFPAVWGNRASDNDKLAWLNIQAQRMNFFTENDGENDEDEDYQRYDTISYAEVLSEICALMGWTAMMRGSTLCLLDNWTAVYRRMTLAQLQAYVSSGTVAYTTQTIRPRQMSSLSFGALHQKTTQYPAFRKVKVKGEVNSFDTSNIELGIDTSYTYIRQRDMDYNRIRFLKELVYLSPQDGRMRLYNSTVVYDGTYVRVSDVPYDPRTDTGAASGYIWCQLARIDFYTNEDLPSKINYQFDDGIFVGLSIPQGTVAPTNTYARIASMRGYIPTVTNGCFDMHFVMDTMSAFAHVNGHLYFCLQCGGRWWDGNSWNGAENSKFAVEIIDSKNVVTKTLNDGYADASGFVIPIDMAVGGEIYLQIFVDVAEIRPYAPAVMLRDLSLAYCDLETNVVKELRETNSYTASKETGYEDSKTITLSMTTKTPSCRNGYGILYLGSNQMGSGNALYRDGGEMILEKSLLASMRKAYLVPTYIAHPVIRAAQEFEPLNVTLIWNGDMWQTRSGSKKWRDCEWELGLYKVNLS